MLARDAEPQVKAQLDSGDYSLRGLAGATGATLIPARADEVSRLVNVNTPEDWETVRRSWLGKEARRSRRVSEFSR